MKKLTFEKENGIWYIVLKKWPGPKGALAMVQGADTLLDKLCNGKDLVTIEVHEEAVDDAIKATLILPNRLLNGGNYTVEGPKGYPTKMWLCAVTRYVYRGRMPKQLYIKTTN